MAGLRLAAVLLCLPMLGSAASFSVIGTEGTAWTKVLGAVGFTQTTDTSADVVVVGPKAAVDVASLAETRIVILEGTGEAAQKLGITTKPETVAVRQICDTHAPKMQIIWERAVDVPVVTLPASFEVFATERWKGVPVLAGKRTAKGAVLWLATEPGDTGIERYPYLMQALVDIGWTPQVKGTTLWAFFDSSYRIRADVDYLARRWRASGVSVLHVAAWHNVEPDATQDAYLKQLIEACHRNAILVYAWLELPHVSEKFWADHPAWREKTALGQDAQLDWRKLMNLQNPECHAEVAKETAQLLGRFDWDGVNVAELYFESLEGASNPARFTPMNDDVRAQFKAEAGFDPKLLFNAGSPYSKDAKAMRKFLDYRAGLASHMQAEWLDVIDRARATKPYLDVVLTHIDDRFEPGIRDALGADVAKSLPLIQARRSTLLVEDPATLWSLGPERYAMLAKKYHDLTSERKRLAVDINIVERYQDVYPTKKQTGVELLELVHQAAASFGRVALYFENSLEKQDLALLPAAATTATLKARSVDEVGLDAAEPVRVMWRGPVEVDGNMWPIQNGESVLAPAGRHVLRAAVGNPGMTISDFNGDIQSASTAKDRMDVSYTSRSRAVAVMGTPVVSVEIDGAPYWKARAGQTRESILLPAGQHLVTFVR